MIDEIFCVERKDLEYMSNYICVEHKALEHMKNIIGNVGHKLWIILC